MNFAGKPLEINRFLGFCDEDDPSNLPVGLAALARNCDFSLTSVMTRAGINLLAGGVNAGIQGLNKSPITGLMGLVYTPESAAESFFQLPLLFDMTGSLQGEFSVGSGSTRAITGALVDLPANSHMIGVQAYNNAYLAFSNLITPTANSAVYNMKTGVLDPYGQKPYGWSWLPNTPMIMGEVGTPTTKNVNGHTYQITGVSGNAETGATEPAWPTGAGDTVADGNVTWTEITPSVGIVYPAYPPVPSWTRTASDSGNWAGGNWIYFAFTYVTAAGETDIPNTLVGLELPSGSFYSGTPPIGTQSYTITCPAPASPPAGYPGDTPTGWNLYIALAPVGTTSVPTPLTFMKWNASPLTFGDVQTVRSQQDNGSGPQSNTAGIVGAGNCDAWEVVAGLNYIPGVGLDHQLYEFGIRYVSVMFVDRNFSVSGFTQASAVPARIYSNGSTLLIENIPTGPPNTIARIVGITELQFDSEINFWDSNGPVTNGTPLGQGSIGTSAGPYFYIGNYTPGPDYFVFPQTTLSDGYTESSTVLGDNTTTTAYFSYTDPFLFSYNDVTDRLRVIWPYPCVDIYYSPSTDRMIQTGVPGFNGHWVSLAGDPESYYSDSGFVPTNNNSGERAICAREFRGVLYSLRERSGYTMQIASIDDVGNASWDVQQRWDKVGPCGPRAVDVCGKFMIFVHRSGIYRYSQELPEPEMVSKEIPYWWQNINWQAAQTIWCAIDEEKHVVRIGVPIGNSTVPNQEILLYYKEGWNTPIHFSTYSGHEISMDSARRFAINDVSAYVGLRIERTIPNPPPDNDASDGIVQFDPSFFTSQFLYGSSGPDGTVMAITPGIWHDGEGPSGPAQGIDWQYETMSQGAMLSFCKIEGMSLNARGQGILNGSFLSGRDTVQDWRPAGGEEQSRELKMVPIDLNINQDVGITRFVPSKFGERWRMRFTNGKVPDAWAELKYAVMFAIPFSSGRPEQSK